MLGCEEGGGWCRESPGVLGSKPGSGLLAPQLVICGGERGGGGHAPLRGLLAAAGQGGKPRMNVMERQPSPASPTAV